MIQDTLSDDDSSAKKGNLSLREIIQKPVHVINFNWASILFSSFFLAYGYYGAITPEYSQFKASYASSIPMLGFIATVFVFFGLLAWKMPDRFRDSIKIHRKDFFVFFSYFAIFFVFSFNQLQFSLFSDEIAYAATSHGQSIYISLALAKYLHVLDGLHFRYLVQFVSLVFLVSLLGLIVLSKRFGWKNRIIIFLLLLILGRLAFSAAHGNSSPHPPLQLIPPFIFGSLFGITDFSFKLSYFFAYTFFILVLYRMMHRVFAFHISYLIALAVGTMPLLWHLGGVVEHALWAAVCFTLVLAEIITSTKLNYPRLVSFISIATLMRQPSFLAILPILILFLADEAKIRDWGKMPLKLLIILSPTLLFIPFLGASLVRGTPSTDALSENSGVGRVLEAVNSNIIWDSISGSVPYWWIILVPLAFIPLSRETAGKNAAFLLFFTSAIFIYYSIHPSLWGYAKYQAEYAVPFAISGLIFLAFKLSRSIHSRRVLAAFVSILILLNIADFVRAPQGGNMQMDSALETQPDASGRQVQNNHFPVAFPYNYHDAYDVIKKENLAENSYSIGATYGILPEIMNGYSVKAIRAAHEIFIKQEPNRLKAPDEGWSVDLIEQDDRIKAVLLGSVPNKQKLIGQFKDEGWGVMGEYRNIRYGTSVVVMKRDGPI